MANRVHKESNNERSDDKCDANNFSFMYKLFNLDQMRMMVGPKFHILSFIVGLSSGFLYGVLSSSEYSLKKYISS